jgi:maltose alpha-D-glucosyltransferase/alpha-amylase
MDILADIRADQTLAGDDLWFKDAIIYQIHVKAFADSNNDGIGDFAGLTGKLDYLQDLGVTALWLLPFYPSPQRDDGYDIADYRNIHRILGPCGISAGSYRKATQAAYHQLVQSTSDQHPWFRARAAASPNQTHAPV